MGNPWETIAPSNNSKNSALIFLSYFKNKYFLEHLIMAISGNVTKYFVLHNIYWHLMVVPVKCSFWFSSYINSQTSVELTADKMQSLLTNQEPNFF